MTKIKICGIKTISAAFDAIDAGADYLGFNFYPASARFVDRLSCMQITSALHEEHSNVKLVGVFVNASINEIIDVLDSCSLDLAQLHGDESPELFEQLSPRAFKAFRGNPSKNCMYNRANAPAFLLDAAVNGVYGGSGITADWTAATELAKQYHFFLAGGLTPENVADAIQMIRPWGVDVASGVETGIGKKDARKMKSFVQAVRSVPALNFGVDQDSIEEAHANNLVTR